LTVLTEKIERIEGEAATDSRDIARR
jgi:hypothetical protein